MNAEKKMANMRKLDNLIREMGLEIVVCPECGREIISNNGVQICNQCHIDRVYR